MYIMYIIQLTSNVSKYRVCNNLHSESIIISKVIFRYSRTQGILLSF